MLCEYAAGGGGGGAGRCGGGRQEKADKMYSRHSKTLACLQKLFLRVLRADPAMKCDQIKRRLHTETQTFLLPTAL